MANQTNLYNKRQTKHTIVIH